MATKFSLVQLVQPVAGQMFLGPKHPLIVVLPKVYSSNFLDYLSSICVTVKVKRRQKRNLPACQILNNNSMTIDFYYIPPSPPSRSVMMLAKYIGVHLNLKLVNVMKGEHMKPSFRKLNPAHTVPTIDDHGVVLWESRPIMTYLVMKYAKNDALYPKDPEKRGTVESRLFFDLCTLYESIFSYGSPVLFGKRDSPDENLLAPIEKAFELLNGFLENSNFVAGDELTIADFSIVSSVSTAQAFGFDVGRYDSVTAWYERCRMAMQKCGFEEINETGTRALTAVFNSNLKI